MLLNDLRPFRRWILLILPTMSTPLKKIDRKNVPMLWGLSFQLMLIGIILFFTYINKPYPHLHDYEVLFTLYYFCGACIINYWLLPQFFYKKQYLSFLLWLILILVFMVFLKGDYLEELFYEDDEKSSSFRHAIYNLVEMAPSMLLFIGVKFSADILERNAEVERLKAVASESELQFLKSQINPHFLFNNLNNLYSYSLENSPKTPKIILGLSSLLRYMLYDSQSKFVPLEKEIKYLEDYVILQELQIENRGKIVFEAVGQFEGKSIAPLILIVFVENCFKHSTSSQAKGIVIEVKVSIVHNHFFMTCKNTFGSHKNTDHLTSGIGLDNVKARLRLLYPNAHELLITSKENIFEVSLSINLTPEV